MREYKDFFALIDPLNKIIARASAKIMEIYASGNYDIKVKDDASPVTKADLAANDIICEGLQTLDSTFPFLSEENMQIPYLERKAYEYFWLIDPLDGTKEFMRKNGQFTVNVCLVHGQIPILGIVAAPSLDEVYYAVKGQGAYLEKNNMTCRMVCSSFSNNQKGLRIPVSLSHINQDTRSIIEQYDSPEVIGRGSALKFMMIANAEADLYPRLAPTMEWDTAAPQIIIEEAGGSVINYETKAAMTYNKESLVNPGFIAYSKLKQQ
jgi:3'(2'), 5'-bisphosphate nucleotidase